MIVFSDMQFDMARGGLCYGQHKAQAGKQHMK